MKNKSLRKKGVTVTLTAFLLFSCVFVYTADNASSLSASEALRDILDITSSSAGVEFASSPTCTEKTYWQNKWTWEYKILVSTNNPPTYSNSFQIINYRALWYETEGAYDADIWVQPEWNYASITGLSPDTQYYVTIIAVEAHFTEPPDPSGNFDGISGEIEYDAGIVKSFNTLPSSTDDGSSDGGSSGRGSGGWSGGSGGWYVSCPYIATWNGTDYEIDNDMLLESSTLPGTEPYVEDHYKLQKPLVIEDDEYKLQIKEDYRYEYSVIDSIKLKTVDHSEDVEVGLCPDGEIYTFKNPVPPISCVDKDDNDILDEISTFDENYFEGVDGDFLIAEFDTIDYSNPKLILNTDGKMDSCGFHPVVPAPENYEPLELYIENYTTNDWIHVRSIYPRTYWSNDIIDLNPFIHHIGDSLKISIYWGGTSHLINHIGIDNSQDEEVFTQTVSLKNAIHSTKGDILQELMYSDNNSVDVYTNEHINLTFSAPVQLDEQRSVIVMARGYYKYKRYEPIAEMEIYRNVDMSLEITGRKDNAVTAIIYEDGLEVEYLELVRKSGKPNLLHSTLNIHVDKEYQLELIYNATHRGANPTQITFESSQSSYLIEETFNTKDGFDQMVVYQLTDEIESVLEGVMIYRFDASNSIDYNGEIESYLWIFADGGRDTNVSSTHEYTEPGIYMVILRVIDDDELVTFTDKVIIIE